MNKDFETEYKDLMAQETASIDADALWNKIEAALPEKTNIARDVEPSKANSCDSTGINLAKANSCDSTGINLAKANSCDSTGINSAKANSDNMVEFVPKKKWYQNPRVISLVGTVAVACILGFVFLNGNNFIKSESPANSPAAYVERNDTICYDEAPMEESEVTAEAPMANSPNGGGSLADIIDKNSDISSEATSEEPSDPNKPAEEPSGNSGQLAFTAFSFKVIEETEEYYICQSLSWDLGSKGNKFYLAKNLDAEGKTLTPSLELEVGSEFCMDIGLLEDVDEMMLFATSK